MNNELKIIKRNVLILCKQKICSFYFTKKDNTKRKLTGKLHFKNLENQTTNPNEFLIVIDFSITKTTYKYYEIENNRNSKSKYYVSKPLPAFRNINLNTLSKIKTNNKTYLRKNLFK
jgi:hypothetical protein